MPDTDRDLYREIWSTTALCATALASVGFAWVALDFTLHLAQAPLPIIMGSARLASNAPWMGVPLLIVVLPATILGYGRIRPRWPDFSMVAIVGFALGMASGVLLV